MKEEIYKYYVDNLSSRKLVFKHMKLRWASFIIITVVTFIYSLAYFITNHIKAGIIALIPFVIYYQFINYWAKNILESKHNIKSDNYIWAGSSYYGLRKSLLIKYLINKNIYTEKKIKELIDICNKEVEKKKRKGFINWGVLLAIFVPLWTQFLSAVFKVSASNISDTIQLFGSMLAIILFIFLMISATKSILNDILNDFLNKESNGFSRLASALEDILFEIDIQK